MKNVPSQGDLPIPASKLGATCVCNFRLMNKKGSKDFRSLSSFHLGHPSVLNKPTPVTAQADLYCAVLSSC